MTDQLEISAASIWREIFLDPKHTPSDWPPRLRPAPARETVSEVIRLLEQCKVAISLATITALFCVLFSSIRERLNESEEKIQIDVDSLVHDTLDGLFNVTDPSVSSEVNQARRSLDQKHVHRKRYVAISIYLEWLCS